MLQYNAKFSLGVSTLNLTRRNKALSSKLCSFYAIVRDLIDAAKIAAYAEMATQIYRGNAVQSDVQY